MRMGLGQPIPFWFAAAGHPSNTLELASIGPSRKSALLKHGTHEIQRHTIMQHTKVLL